ncbi:MAG: substrate-binding domain-containing protein [bacterium]|nr:substrate-binding domain-containing protein [bacterium]
MKKYSLIVAVLLSTALTVVAFGQTVLIVNTANNVTSMSRTEVSNFYLGKTTKWSNGEKAIPVDQKKVNSAGKAFLANIVKMSESEFKKEWMSKMLSGEAEPLLLKANDEEVIEFVKANKGGIGYVSASSVEAGVKFVAIDGKKEW